jgi:hypothetical protein
MGDARAGRQRIGRCAGSAAYRGFVHAQHEPVAHDDLAVDNDG